jgi:hypothetical protein
MCRFPGSVTLRYHRKSVSRVTRVSSSFNTLRRTECRPRAPTVGDLATELIRRQVPRERQRSLERRADDRGEHPQSLAPPARQVHHPPRWRPALGQDRGPRRTRHGKPGRRPPRPDVQFRRRVQNGRGNALHIGRTCGTRNSRSTNRAGTPQGQHSGEDPVATHGVTDSRQRMHCDQCHEHI